MDPLSSHSSLHLTPEEDKLHITMELIDFHHPFDIETRVDNSTTDFLERCSLDYGSAQNNKIMPVPSRGPREVSECSEECELDGSYVEYVETQWTKGSTSSDGDADSASRMDSIDIVQELRSESDSVVVSAPLHGPTVKCVCVCNKKGCEFMNKPFDALSIRESPVSRMSISYKLTTWLRSMRPYRMAPSPSLDQIDSCSKVHPEKKLKIIQLFKSKRGKTATCSDYHESKTLKAIRKYIPKLIVRKSSVSSDGSERLKSCEVSVPRTLAVFVGLAFIMLGVTYDHGVKHGVDNILQDCWSWLRTSYMNFGDEFVSYNSIFFRMTNTDTLYGEPYPRYGPNSTKKVNVNLTRFQEAINNADPRFLFILEGLKLSVQLHFFSIDENSEKNDNRVVVHEKGPLFFRISFVRTSGLHIDYVPERSKMNLSTPFQVYDLMKMIILSNELPYFGFHMHDHHKTTPSALLTMIIDNLKKFKVDTTFLSSIQAQIEGVRIKRSTTEEKNASNENSLKNPEPLKQVTGGPTSSQANVTVSPTPCTISSTRATIGNYSSLMVALERMRRSTEEPKISKVTWKSLAEISRKIFLPLPLDTKRTVFLPMPFLKKNLTLKYRHAVNVLGLPGYQFILGNDVDKDESSSPSKPELYPSLSYSRVKDGEETETTANPHLQRHRYNEKKKHHRHYKHQNFLENDVYKNSFNEVLGVADLEPFLLETIGSLLLMGRHLEHYPFWVSAPHFLSLANHIKHVNKTSMSSEPLTSSSVATKVSTVQSKTKLDTTHSNILVGVDGLAAEESAHGSFIYYHPILGVPINASLAVQVGVRPPEGMLHAHKLVPVMWARAQVEEIPLTLWYILWAACHLRETIMIILILTGILIITCAFTCGKKKSAGRPDSA